MVGAYAACVEFIKLSKLQHGDSIHFSNISSVGSDSLQKALGAFGDKVIISQVVPFPWNSEIPLVKEYAKALATYQHEYSPGFTSLEGYIAGRLFCAIAREVKGELTRENFISTMEKVGRFDLGGIVLEFGPDDHQGLDTIISFQSFLENNGGEWRKDDGEISFFADKAGFPSLALRQKAAVISNIPCEACESVIYPTEKGPIQNHIDVPIVDQDRVPLIAGVCNRQGGYGESDVGQVNLLLEKMWHHFLKISSEREMTRLRNLLKGINDSMPSVLIGVDMNGRGMQWNKEAERVTMISAGDAEHRLLSQVFPRLTGYLWRIQAVIASGVPDEERNVPYYQDGETRFDTITIYPLVAEHVTGAVIRLDDVTEKVRIEDLMVQSEKMLSVGGLAAGMAHEINNPLAGILQNLQVVQNRFSPDLPKNVEVAREFGIRMEDVEGYIKARSIDVCPVGKGVYR